VNGRSTANPNAAARPLIADFSCNRQTPFLGEFTDSEKPCRICLIVANWRFWRTLREDIGPSSGFARYLAWCSRCAR